MKKITLIIFILAILLFGGKFGLERYYESKLDKLIGLVKFSVGDINHKGVTIGFDGSISINRLSIRPHAIDTTVSIEKISLFSSDRLLPLKIANSFEKKEIPENIGLRVNDLEYNPNLYMPKIDSKNECRYIETPINYSSLGIRKLNSDLEMSINTSNKSDSLIEMTSVDQTSSSKLRLVFDANKVGFNLHNSDTLPITDVEIDYKINESTAAKLIDYCADKLQLSRDDYLTKVIGSANYTRIIGIDLGEEAQQALIDVMQGGKWLSIKSTPSKQLKSLNSAKFYQPKDIIRLMNLSINIDNTPVKLNGSELTKTNDLDNTTTVNPDNDVIDSSIETQLQPQTLTEDQRRVQQKKLSLMRDKAELSYQITSLKDLNQYKNHGIKVKRNNNKKTITGELVSIDDTTFSIETTEYGGIAVFKISKSDVIELQVYR